MKHILTALVILSIFSCQSQAQEDWQKLTKNKDGFYTSLPGGFKAKFPKEPIHTEREVDAGAWKAIDHSFRYYENKYLMFVVSFMDFPSSYIKKLNSELLIESTVDQMIAATNNTKIIEKKKKQTENGQEIYFELASNDPSIGGFTYGRVILVDNRLYKVVYGGTSRGQPKTDQIDFVTKFKVIRKK